MNLKGFAMAAILLLFQFILFHPAAATFRSESLREGFYDSTCPQAEDIVRRVVETRFFIQPSIVAGLVRLHFHDCFVRGCDASILLDQIPGSEPVEKSSPANGDSLRGLEAIDEAKFFLEAECPSTVSCADVIAFAARDAATLAGLPRYNVPAGRRDGYLSLAPDPLANLPSPYANLTSLVAAFARKGLNRTELAVLSGAHSIGGVHCYSIYTDTTPPMAKMECPTKTSGGKVYFDPVAPMLLDGTSYYRAVEEGRGLLATDRALMTDKETRRAVREMARNPEMWADEFARLMVRLGTLDVLVGSEGEVRSSCRSVN